MWEWACIREVLSTYGGFNRVRETPSRSLTLPIFTYFSSISLPCAILTHLFVMFAPKYPYILLFTFILALKHHIS